MPELPEVEVICRSLRPHLVGCRMVAVRVTQPALRWPVDVGGLRQAVCGAQVIGIRRRAKYLLFDLERQARRDVLAVHLGMSGRLNLLAPTTAGRPHDHVIFSLEDGRELRFNDARRFGSVLTFAPPDEVHHPRLAHLGVEPLDAAAFNGHVLHKLCRRSLRPLKSLLLDGTCVVGVGNIYACEALFLAGIHPTLRGQRLGLPRAHRLAEAIVTTLKAAIAQGGTTLRDFVDATGRAGLFKVHLQVYGRAGLPCLRCSRPVRRLVQAGRSTYLCPACQCR